MDSQAGEDQALNDLPDPPVAGARYDPAPLFETTNPPKLEFRVVVVAGEEGAELRCEQAKAVRELLRWVRRHRLQDAPVREEVAGE